MTLLSRLSVLAAKVEATPGTAETLAAADAAFNVMNAEMNANIDVSTRPIQGSFRKLPGVPGMRTATCTFSLELIGDGAGGVPTWATTFLSACGLVNTTGTLTPRNENPGTNVKTLTIGLYEAGRRKLMRGAVGNVVFEFVPGQPVMMNFTFTGVWVGVTDTAILAPTYPTLAPIRAANGAATINSVVQTFSSCSFDVGNVVAIRPSVANDEGATHGIITDRTPTFTIDPEATVASGNDIWADWITPTTHALSLNVNDNIADQVTFAAPAVQRMTISNGDREGLRIDQQTLQCCRDGANAEFSLTFASP
jgi:hypothetical protein